MDNNDACSLGPVTATPAHGLCPAGTAPELQRFFSSYSTLCDWAGGAGVAPISADTLNFNNGNTKAAGMPYGFTGPDMIDDHHPFSFLLHGSAVADPWSNGLLSPQELLAARPGPAFGFEGAWAGPGLVATAAPYA